MGLSQHKLKMTPVEQIKDRLSIVDVVSTYVKLDQAGKNLKAKSPFSSERTPSFFVSPEKGLFHCFSTGKGGDMFTFVQEMEGVDFKGALKILADMAGVSLKPIDKKIEDEKDRLYEILEKATVFFQNELFKNQEALEYLKQRGVTDETIKIWRIGYAPNGWRNFYDHIKKDYLDNDIVISGMGKKSEKGVYDTFRDRIMFPICDTADRTIAFSGRILHPDEKSAKYVNSPDTPLFNKSSVLFGLSKAKNYIRKYDFTTLVEGQFDVIMLHQSGFRNTVGVSGTALSSSLNIENSDRVNNLGLVKRLSSNLVLAFDSDNAGFNASKRAANIALSLGMDVKAIKVPYAKDPADFIKENGKDAWGQVLRQAKHIIEFNLDRLKETSKDSREFARRVKEDILPSILEINSNMERAIFVKKISEDSLIPEEIIWKDIENLSATQKNQNNLLDEDKKDPSKIDRKKDIEKKLMSLYYLNENDKDIKDNIVRVVREDVFKSMDDEMSLIKEKLIFEIESLVNQENKERFIREMLLNLEEEYLNQQIFENKVGIKKAESLGLDEEAEILTKKHQDLLKRLSEIKNSRYLNKY